MFDASCRSADQMRVTVAYTDLPVKIGGAHGGSGEKQRRGGEEQNFEFERQGSTTPGRRSEPGQTTSPRQPGLGESGRTGSPGQRSS